jgi:hypothetical protein
MRPASLGRPDALQGGFPLNLSWSRYVIANGKYGGDCVEKLVEYSAIVMRVRVKRVSLELDLHSSDKSCECDGDDPKPKPPN